MLRKPRIASDHWHWVCFFRAIKDSNFLRVGEPVGEDELYDWEGDEDMGFVIEIPDNTYNPELLYQKKERFNDLSNEAKYVVGLIFKAPAELLTPTKKEITKTTVWDYLRWKQRWTSDRINNVFKEITQLVATF